jgi:chromosome segregation ATPase
MLQPPSLDAVHSGLDPVEALRGEQSQLEAWVRESTTALEALNDELTEWQRDLTRQQAELDQREAALCEAESLATSEGRTVAVLEAELTRVRDESRQLEEENAEQLQTQNGLERQLVAAQTALRAARKHADELADALDAERERELEEHRLFAGELREMRRVLHQQGAMLVSLGAALPADEEETPDQELAEGDDAAGADAAGRAAELRRRGAARRANRRPP